MRRITEYKVNYEFATRSLLTGKSMTLKGKLKIESTNIESAEKRARKMIEEYDVYKLDRQSRITLLNVEVPEEELKWREKCS